METLIISDLHLKKQESTVTSGFLHFLRNEALTADALYILGDLFEVWIGDDDPNPLNRDMAIAIKSLVDSGVPCYFIHGNHDFLIGQRFAAESGMTLLPKEQSLNLYGYKVLIMHGDTLCIDDIEYQIFRSNIHKPWIQKLFLSLPLFIRNYTFEKVRLNSIVTKQRKLLSIMDVNQQAVIEVMTKHRVQYLIHGHTHRPNIHKIIINNCPAFRFVLSAWCRTGSIVKVTPENIELLFFSL